MIHELSQDFWVFQTLWPLKECVMCTLISGLSPDCFSEGESAQLWTQNSEIDAIVSISGISVTQRRKPHVFQGQQTIFYLQFPFLVIRCGRTHHHLRWLPLFPSLIIWLWPPDPTALLARRGQTQQQVVWIGVASATSGLVGSWAWVGDGGNRRLRNPGPPQV